MNNLTDTQRGQKLTSERQADNAAKRILNEWNQAVRVERAKGLSESKAMAAVAKSEPLLHRVWLNVKNNRPLGYGL